jgi:hypothetical protein
VLFVVRRHHYPPGKLIKDIKRIEQDELRKSEETFSLPILCFFFVIGKSVEWL